MYILFNFLPIFFLNTVSKSFSSKISNSFSFERSVESSAKMKLLSESSFNTSLEPLFKSEFSRLSILSTKTFISYHVFNVVLLIFVKISIND